MLGAITYFAVPAPKNRLAYFALQNKTNYNMRANKCTYININYFLISVLVANNHQLILI